MPLWLASGRVECSLGFGGTARRVLVALTELVVADKEGKVCFD